MIQTFSKFSQDPYYTRIGPYPKNLRAKLKEMNKDGWRFQIVVSNYHSFTDNYPPDNSHSTTYQSVLKSFVINFQSIMAKRAEFHYLIHDHHPDIILSCKIRLYPSVNTAEYFPKGCNVFRLDRCNGYGGVLLAFRNTLNIVEYPLTNIH